MTALKSFKKDWRKVFQKGLKENTFVVTSYYRKMLISHQLIPYRWTWPTCEGQYIQHCYENLWGKRDHSHTKEKMSPKKETILSRWVFPLWFLTQVNNTTKCHCVCPCQTWTPKGATPLNVDIPSFINLHLYLQANWWFQIKTIHFKRVNPESINTHI